MIDFHTHILPAVDDGAADKEEAMALIAALMKEGVKTAVCTPHFDPGQCSIQDFVRSRGKAMQELKDAAIRLVAASETGLHDYLFHYSDLEPICIEKTKYLLLELPFYGKWNDRLYSMIDNLISYYDIIPIIAHIERYPAAKKAERCIRRLKDTGCLIQLNTSSLLNARNQKRALKYIKKGYVDLLGSDCHDCIRRPPAMMSAVRLIEAVLGKECCRRLEDNAINVLNNIDIRR
jgi:hypothetical protein